MNVFIKTAFIVTAVFIVGIFVGAFIDINNTNVLRQDLELKNIELSDIMTQSSYFSLFENGTEFCNASIEGNIQFADDMYQKGLEIEKMEYTNRFSPLLQYEKQKYMASKLQFWFNAINLRQKCNANYTTLVYFYTQNTSMVTDAAQKTQAVVLEGLKQSCGNKLLLIPIQTDVGLSVVNMIISQYNIDNTPAILVNETYVLKGLQDYDSINKYVSC